MYDCVPIQGSGTFAVESMLGTFIPKNGKLLVLANGAYGLRAAQTMDYLNRKYHLLDKGDYLPPRGSEVADILEKDKAITHVLVIHCETSSGILNPLEEIGAVVKTAGRKLLIDSMSAFGAVPVDPEKVDFEAMVSSANKCIEGVPGLGLFLRSFRRFRLQRVIAILLALMLKHNGLQWRNPASGDLRHQLTL